MKKFDDSDDKDEVTVYEIDQFHPYFWGAQIIKNRGNGRLSVQIDYADPNEERVDVDKVRRLTEQLKGLMYVFKPESKSMHLPSYQELMRLVFALTQGQNHIFVQYCSRQICLPTLGKRY